MSAENNDKHNVATVTVDKKGRSLSRKETIFRTFLLYASFAGLGMCFSIVGPTLQDISFKLNTDTQHMTTIYTARSSGLILGCFLAGYLLEKFHRVALVGLSVMLAGIFTSLIPWCPNLTVLIIVMVISGMTMGMVDTGSNVWCLDLWPKNCGPFIHALHFSFGLGTFFAPLIAEPFLIPTEITSHPEKYSGQNIGFYEEYSFGIIGATMVATAFTIFTIVCINPCDPMRYGKHAPPNDMIHNHPLGRKRFRLISALLVFLTVAQFLTYGGIEIAYGQLISTYAVKIPQPMTKSEASYLSAMFWGGFTTGRGSAIIITNFISNFKLIVVNLVMIVASTWALFLFNKFPLVLWICSGTFGLGMSGIYPATYGWLESHIEIGNKVGGMFAIGTAAGEMVIPFIVGLFIADNPITLMYASVVCSSIMVIIFIVTWLITRTLPHIKGKKMLLG